MSTFGQGPSNLIRESLALRNSFTVVADMTSATWNTVGAHEIATVTGTVHMWVLCECMGTLTDSVTDLATIALGIEGAPASLIAAIGAAGFGGDTIAIGEFWVDITPNETFASKMQLDALDFVIAAGKDVGYTLAGEALTGGSLKFHIYWEALPTDPTGNVVAGAGGAL